MVSFVILVPMPFVGNHSHLITSEEFTNFIFQFLCTNALGVINTQLFVSHCPRSHWYTHQQTCNFDQGPIVQTKFQHKFMACLF